MAFNAKKASPRMFHGIYDVIFGSAVVDPASVATGAAGQGSTTVTVTGAVLGDFVIFHPGVDTTSVQITCSVTAADTLKIMIQNLSGGAIDLASSTWRFTLLRPKSLLAAI
jgi:hypothetical protein